MQEISAALYAGRRLRLAGYVKTSGITGEVRPPFSPTAVIEEFAALLKSYGISRVTGDRYAGEWPREQFRKHGIEYEVSGPSASDLYREYLPLINSERVELLDHPRLLAQ